MKYTELSIEERAAIQVGLAQKLKVPVRLPLLVHSLHTSK